jgi:predicted ATPase/DNA-binding XRE family transcriptional regulator
VASRTTVLRNAGRHQEKSPTELPTDRTSVCTHLVSALAPLLRRLREAAGLTQEELAERAAVSSRTISDAERGLRTRIYADTAGRIADALNLTEQDRETFFAIARGRRQPELGSQGDLPHPLTPLVDRTTELALLEAVLDPGSDRRLVTVTGLAGTGKTRLAIGAAARLHPRYASHVRFVPLAATEAGRVADAVATALSTVPTRIAAAVGDRPTLVVLDSFEHVLDDAAWLAGLLQHAPTLRVLVTSRVRLGISGEQELPLGPLGADDAARLFLDRARDLVPDLLADDVAIAEICRLTSGLPLPLELAAAQVGHLPLHLLTDRLRSGLADANRVVQDAVAWSISSLSADARSVLAGASMFAAGARFEALEAVCRPVDVVPALGQLVDRRLVVLDRTGTVARWRMLDAVREAAIRLVAPDIERRGAYTAFYLEFLRGADQQLGHEDAWYQQLAAEEPNIRAALGWAEGNRDADTLLRLATGMWLFWQSRGGLEEGRRWLRSGLAMRPAADDQLQMTALWGLAWLAYHQGDDAAAESAGRKLAELAVESGQDLPRRNALTIGGMVAIAGNRPREAIALLTDALRIARELQRPWILAASLLNLALAQLAVPSPDAARPLLGEALQQYDDIGDRRFHARCLGYLGLASLLDGDPERARALFLQSFTSFRGLAEPAGIAEGLAGLAAVEAATGEAATAAVLAAAAERTRDSVATRELPLERRIAERYLGTAADRIGPEAWAEAWRRGRQLGIDDIATELGLSG